MNKLEYYNRQKEEWDDKEIQNLRNEYEKKEMTISQIADIHFRTPGSISYKLKYLGIVNNNTESRGYLDYKNSNLYNEIVSSGKKKDSIKKTESKKRGVNMSDNEITLKIKAESNTSFTEIIELRNEITDLKKDVKEILRLMNALYDFENQNISS